MNVARLLEGNLSLDELFMQETKDHQKYWETEARTAFTELLRQGTKIKFVNMVFTREDLEENQTFQSQVNFYTKMKAQRQQKMENYSKIKHSCDPDSMFSDLQELIDKNEEKACEMPVRKFYNNTFGTLLNRAKFALKKK